MENRSYQTLPASSRRDPADVSLGVEASTNGRAPSRARLTPSPSSSPSSSLFGLNINLGLSNLISGGLSGLFGQLRRKAPPVSSSSPSSSALTLGAGYKSKSTSFSASEDIESLSTPSSSKSNAFGFRDPYEHIEMSCLPQSVDPGQTGAGHEFEPIGTFNPTWCDRCGELIWGLFDTGASRCIHCDFTCHVKCQAKIRLDCSILLNNIAADARDEDEADATLANISTLRSELGGTLVTTSAPPLLESPDSEDANGTLKDADHVSLEHDWEEENPAGGVPLQSEAQFGTNLLSAIDKYNSLSPAGQETVYDSDTDVCRGFIRVAMDLRRPIHVVSGSGHTLTDDCGSLGSVREGERTLTSFYLPPDTVKALHVTSNTTTRDVIRSLLSKFRVADNPHKYVLYEKTLFEAESAASVANGGCDPWTVGRVRLRRLRDEERPLLLALGWCLLPHEASLNKRFVLQENDPGEVAWESFSLPELKNFLLILDREEAWYKKRIHDRYESARAVMQQMLEEKRSEKQ